MSNDVRVHRRIARSRPFATRTSVRIGPSLRSDVHRGGEVAIPSDVDLDLVDVEDENIKAVSISNGVNTMRRFEADE